MTKDYKWERERLSRFCTWCEIVFRYDKEADFPFVEVDDGFCRMLGYEREELMESCHERIRYLIYPPDFQRIEQDVLRQLDKLQATEVYVHAPEPEEMGLAVYNRLLRAAAFRVVHL